MEMLKENTSDSYPGAGYVAVDPVTSAECCSLQSEAAIVAGCVAAGYAYIYRAGRLWIGADVAQMLALCQGVLPIPASFSADPMTVGAAYDCVGTLFGAVEGTFWLTDDGTWGSEGVKVGQTIGLWEVDNIDFDVVKGGLPVSPTKIYGYVETLCGAVNAAGLEGTIVDP
jgi:hypothetical protein